jgi:outer membrane protein assembly factor BamB
LYAGRLYTVNDTGIATCLDAATGKMLWQARIRDQFSASPLESVGRLYCCAESGVTYVLAAGEQFEVLAKNDLGEPILASPAALDGRLYLRTSGALVCLAALDQPAGG